MSTTLEKSIADILGDMITTIAEKAKAISIETNDMVEFKFNDILCIVDKNTNLDLLIRDYHTSFIMNWNIIGPICVDEYDAETKKNIQVKTEERKRKSDEEHKKYQLKCDVEKLLVDNKIKNITFEVGNIDN